MRTWVMVFFILLFCRMGYGQDSHEIYQEGVQAARAGDLDYAFMYFQSLVKESPESKHGNDALFAMGEYYFVKGDYPDANNAFIKLINDYPDSKGEVFALAYLLKIAESRGNDDLAQNLEDKIVTSKRLVLLFKDSKEYKYKSPLNKKYKAVYYIDKVHFYLDGELFAQISY
jgi:outer membrane protein assembly factor BamD (BamD/ComL family)